MGFGSLPPLSERLVAGLAGAATGGAALGVLDVARLLAGLSLGEAGTLLAVGACAGAAQGLWAGLALAIPAVWLQPWLWRGRWAAAAGFVALAALALDATVLVGLYPQAHAWLGWGAVAAAALSGLILMPSNGVAVIGAGLLAVTGHTGLAAPAAGLKLRQVVIDGGTLTARVVTGWPEPAAEAAPAQGCAWPEAAPAPTRGRLAGAPVIWLTVDAWRHDEGLAALPLTAQRLGPVVEFTRAYAPANRTTETMFSVLTGRWPHHLRFTPTRVDQQDQPVDQAPEASLVDPRTWTSRTLAPLHDPTPTLTTWLKAAGYTPATVVAYLFLRPHLGVTRGFEHADIAPYLKSRDREGITSEIMAERTLAWLETAPDRFFLWLHWMDPHEPYHPFGDVRADAGPRGRYRAELARTDAALARVLDALAERGILDRALVVLSADHGEEFGEHGGKFHGTSVYDEQVRVPLVIRAPAARARRVDAPVSLLDLTPTTVDLLGLQGAPPLDGRSLADVIYGGPLAPRPVLTRSSRSGYRYAVVDGPWKLMVDFTRRAMALYHLGDDPAERVNRVEEHPEIYARLACLLDAAGVRP